MTTQRAALSVAPVKSVNKRIRPGSSILSGAQAADNRHELWNRLTGVSGLVFDWDQMNPAAEAVAFRRPPLIYSALGCGELWLEYVLARRLCQLPG
jgi:hypothetical protein